MRPSDLLCRLCRTSYGIQELGCATCIPAKRNIMWPDATADHVQLHGPAQQALRLLESNMDRLEASMKTDKLQKFSPDWARAANANAAAMAKLVAEMRKLEESALRKTKNLSHEERAEIFVEMFRDLPREHQVETLRQCDEIVNAPPPGVLEIFAEPV